MVKPGSTLRSAAALPEPIPVAVNLSPVEFRQKDFVAAVAAVLEETGLDPRWLAFELTEGVDRLDQLEILRARGCDEAQGFLLCDAMRAADLAGWLARPHSGTVTPVQT